MPASAIVVLIFGSVVFYGGLAYCLYRAVRGKKDKTDSQ